MLISLSVLTIHVFFYIEPGISYKFNACMCSSVIEPCIERRAVKV